MIRKLDLKDREGRRLTVLLREYRLGDEPGMIACIRDEYGETYFKRGLYDPDYIHRESAEGHISFLVAQVLAEESEKKSNK